MKAIHKYKYGKYRGKTISPKERARRIMQSKGYPMSMRALGIMPFAKPDQTNQTTVFVE